MGISQRITEILIAQSIVPKEEREVYEYGFELLTADLFHFSVMLLVGGIVGRLWHSVLYIAIFVGLRSVCGGYHAKTHLRCHICTIGMFLVFLLLLHTELLTSRVDLLILGNFFAALPVILFAPIAHANKPLSEPVRKRNRVLSIGLYFLLTLSAAILSIAGRQEGAVISLTLWIVSLCMIPAINMHAQ